MGTEVNIPSSQTSQGRAHEKGWAVRLSPKAETTLSNKSFSVEHIVASLVQLQKSDPQNPKPETGVHFKLKNTLYPETLLLK